MRGQQTQRWGRRWGTADWKGQLHQWRLGVPRVLARLLLRTFIWQALQARAILLEEWEEWEEQVVEAAESVAAVQGVV